MTLDKMKKISENMDKIADIFLKMGNLFEEIPKTHNQVLQEYLEKSEFGSFDLNRQLIDYEMKHFNEFMKPIDHSKSAKDVSLSEAVDSTIANLKVMPWGKAWGERKRK